MIIREAREDEQPLIRELRLNAYNEHAKKISRDHWNVLKESILSDADTGEDVVRLVAELDGKIVGSVVIISGKGRCI